MLVVNARSAVTPGSGLFTVDVVFYLESKGSDCGESQSGDEKVTEDFGSVDVFCAVNEFEL